MMEATINLDITREGGTQRLPSRRNPVQDRTLETFCVISSSTGSTLLDLI